jgi:hypothetical protein
MPRASATTATRDHRFRSLLAQFGLTPNSNRGLAASDPVDALGQIGEGSTG